jgi:ankyrin repeat protein
MTFSLIFRNVPLLIFAYSRKIDNRSFWKLLVENGCNINIKDSKGNTILHIAVLHILVNDGSIDDIKYIINNGINKDIQNNDGKTALMIATRAKNSSIDDMKKIIDNNIYNNVYKNIKNENKKKALMMAKDKKMTEIISVINPVKVADANKQKKSYMSKLRKFLYFK